MINTAKAIKFLNDQELFKTSYPEDDLQEHIARQMQKYADQQLTSTGVSQQSELLELVTEIANSKQDYSNTRHKLWAKKLISSNCG